MASFRAAVLDIDGLVPGGPVAYSEVDVVARTLDGMVRPDWLMREGWRELFERHAPEHPVISHIAETGDLAPRSISDMVSEEELHRSALYKEFFARVGTEDQISFGLPSSPRMVLRIAINRPSRGFSAEERELLGMLAPHLGTAYLAARARTIAGSGMGVAGDDLVVLDETDRVTALVGKSEQMLAAAGLGTETGKRLPPALADRLGEPAEVDEIALGPRPPTSLDGDDSTLMVQTFSGDMPGADRILALSVDADALGSERATELGITPREAEVANLIARGLSNPDIVERLQLSPHTLKRHIEHLYPKLGVGSRAAAVARLLGEVG